MVVKTFRDCAACPVVSRCSAHVSDGEWQHDEGVDPCKVVDKKEERGFMSSMFTYQWVIRERMLMELKK